MAFMHPLPNTRSVSCCSTSILSTKSGSQAGLVPSSTTGASRTGPQFYKLLYFGGCAQIKILLRGVMDSKNFRSGLKVGDPIHRFLCSESKSDLVWYHFSSLAQKNTGRIFRKRSTDWDLRTTPAGLRSDADRFCR